MKLCFSTLGCAERSLDEILALSEKYSINAIEIRGIGGIIDNGKIEDFSEKSARKTKQKLSDAGVCALGLGTSVSFHDPSLRDAKIKEGRESIDIAARLGISAVRVFGDRIVGDVDECYTRVGSGIVELCDYAAPLGVNIYLEVHGDFNVAESILRVVDLLREKSNFGIIWDIEHTHKTYGEKWESFYLPLRHYIKHVHVKDFSDSRSSLSAIGEGDVPIIPILKRLIADNYDGAVSLEWEAKWHPELGPIEPALTSFVKMVSEAENDSRS